MSKSRKRDERWDDMDAPPKDKLGFATPRSPGHSLMLLNGYMRTSLLGSLHNRLHEIRGADMPGSPIHHLALGLEWVLDMPADANAFGRVNRNPYHVAAGFEFRAEEDYAHDLRLMKHHLKCHRQTIKELAYDD